MATKGPAVVTGPTVVTGPAVVTGQGPISIIRARYTTDDASISSPVWQETSIREFDFTRGRSSTLSEFETGQATLTLDNRTRTFDPLNNALIRPFSRWWIYEEFSGAVEDLFRGYAISYVNEWPEKGKDAIAVVTLMDELGVLAAQGLPTTDPVRESYSALIAVDLPEAYWDLNDDPTTRVLLDTGDNVVHDFYQEPVDPPRDRRGDRKATPAKALRKRF